MINIRMLLYVQGPERTSALLAPTMLLSGHLDQVFAVRFNPKGDVIASGSHDKKIFLWRTYGECENFSVLSGHRNAVLQVQWTGDGEHLVSCSPDKTVRAWDSMTGEQIGILREHTDIVNSCSMQRRGTPVAVSGSDDCTTKLWDMRSKRAARTFEERYQITAVEISETGDQVFTGGIDNKVKVWDLRRDEVIFTLEGHSDTITGMELSPSGTHMLTNAMDNTMRSWDVRPYAPSNRCERVFTGHTHGFEKNLLRCSWSPDGKQVSGGSGDQMVHIWNVATGDEMYRLPGHSGSINEVAFHPVEPIVASASSDKTIYLGELALV